MNKSVFFGTWSASISIIFLLFMFGCSDDETTNHMMKPTVTTVEVISITESTAISGGIVSSDGGAEVVSRGICWSIFSNPTIENSKTVDYNGLGSFLIEMTGLEPDTEYFVRAYAVNRVGVSYGNNLIFKTLCEDVAGKFVDPSFRLYCLLNFDANGDRKLDMSEISVIRAIYIGSMNIKSLAGIEHFTKLETLACYDNQLTNLDVSRNAKLVRLNCANNQLPILDVSQNTELTDLSCENNLLTTLNISNNVELVHFACSNNQLTSLDVVNNTQLTGLWCAGNHLTTLRLNELTELWQLNCSYNKLSILDVSNNTALYSLYCNNNSFTTLDISNNTDLYQLDCRENPITTIWVWKGFNIDNSPLFFYKPNSAKYEIKP